VSTALLGAVVRQRAARSLASHGGANRCRLPFSVVASEPSESRLSNQLAELLVLADQREHRAAEAVAAAFASNPHESNQNPSPTLLDVARSDGIVGGDDTEAPVEEEHAAGSAHQGGSGSNRLSVAKEDEWGAEAVAAEAVAAAAAARRDRTKGEARAQATFAALPDEERRLRRIKHNFKLMRTLVELPCEQVCESAEALLGWESPGVSGALFWLMQVLVLFDWLAYVPAMLCIAVAAHVMEIQRCRRAEGAPPYRVDYHYPHTKGMLRKARRLDTLIARADTLVQRILICLLKMHSAYESVDEFLSLRFALGLLVLGLLFGLFALMCHLIPPWLLLSTAIIFGFSVRHPLRALFMTRDGRNADSVPISSAAAAGMWSLVSMIAITFIAPFQRVLCTMITCAVVLGCWYYKKFKDQRVRTGRLQRNDGIRDNSDLLGTIQNDSASGLLSTYRQELQRQVREWWELLPAPSVRNTADQPGSGDPLDLPVQDTSIRNLPRSNS
jgi:hypothetical protein